MILSLRHLLVFFKPRGKKKGKNPFTYSRDTKQRYRILQKWEENK